MKKYQLPLFQLSSPIAFYPETPKQKTLLGQAVRFGDRGFGSGGGGILNIVSEVLDALGKLGSDPGWIAFDEVVRAEVVVRRVVFQHVIDGSEDRSRDCDHRLLGTAACLEAEKLGLQIGSS